MHVEERERKREKTNRIPLVSCGLIDLFFSFIFFKPRPIISFFYSYRELPAGERGLLLHVGIFYLISNYDHLLLIIVALTPCRLMKEANHLTHKLLYICLVAYRKIFIANMYRITHEAQFQRWRSQFFTAFRTGVNVSLAELLSEAANSMDSDDPNARIITFHPFYFSLGFKFPISRFFKEVFHVMGCAPC